MTEKIRLGTRASALALAQARLTQDRFQALFPSVEIELVTIKTTGDRLAQTPLGEISTKGIFIKEIEDALLEKRVDIAVHSLKDLPTEFPAGLVLGAVLEREDPRDCVISRFGEQLLELPRGAVVGTSSLRRQAQIRAVKDKIRLKEVRGNLDTRIKKVLEGEYDSIVVAHAGVKRLNRQDEVSEILSFELMLPAPGQGCIALEARAEDSSTRDRLSELNHAPSLRAVEAERAFLAELGGGCRVPIAAYAREEKSFLVIDGLVISGDGKKKARGRESGPLDDPTGLGKALAKNLLAQGARDILAATPPSEPVPEP